MCPAAFQPKKLEHKHYNIQIYYIERARLKFLDNLDSWQTALIETSEAKTEKQCSVESQNSKNVDVEPNRSG